MDFIGASQSKTSGRREVLEARALSHSTDFPE